MFVFAVWQWIFWNKNSPKLNLNVAAISYFFRVANNFRKFFTPVINNIARIRQVKFKILQAHSLFVAKIRARTNTKQNLVRVLIFVRQIVTITSHHHFNIKLLRKLNQALVDFRLHVPVRVRLRMSVVLQLQIIAITKN